MSSFAWLTICLQALIYVSLAPLLTGWIRKAKARLQNRRGPSVFQPYRDLRKLLAKDVHVAHTASPLFRVAPYIVFVSTWLAAITVPILVVELPTAAVADLIVLVGLLALGRFFLALAGMDVGTAFGGMGASREMLISALAEPAMLMAVFTLAMQAHSTNLSTIVTHQIELGLSLKPSLMFALAALSLVAIAETGRIPVDNPATHLELTMVHEAMLLEYTGRHLALMEWAAQVKLMLYGALIVAIFFPWGMTEIVDVDGVMIALLATLGKLALLGAVLAGAETVLAKARLFRVPALLNFALLLGLLGLLSHVILEIGT